jgi:hypothetical protein
MPDCDLSEFKALSKPKKPPCQIGQALKALGGGEADLLRAALAEDRRIITPGAIVTWLERRSVSTNTSAVRSHRDGTCTCAAYA